MQLVCLPWWGGLQPANPSEARTLPAASKAFVASSKTTPGGKLVLWWDVHDVAQGDPSAVPSVGAGGGRVRWRGSPHRYRLSRRRIDFPARNHPPDLPLARCRQRRRRLANRRLLRRSGTGDEHTSELQ